MKHRQEAKQRQAKRELKIKSKIRRLRKTKLHVTRTAKHMRAQVIDVTGKVLATASTLEKAMKASLKVTGGIEAAQAIGKLIGERAKAAGVSEVAFDRAGNLYHGRVKALADAAREAGLQF